MQNPLKQGLKLVVGCASAVTAAGRNAKSTKTRIETCMGCIKGLVTLCRNAKSTKTRIETEKAAAPFTKTAEVAMQNPLKQGLKQYEISNPLSAIFVAMQNPLKQGLKPVALAFERVRLTGRNAKSTKTRIETNIGVTNQ